MCFHSFDSTKMNSNDEKLHSYFEYVIPLIKEAGQVTFENFSNNHFDKQFSLKKIFFFLNKVILEAENIVLEYKSDITDLVTKYDRQVEKLLIDELKRKYPDHKFVSQ